MIVLLCGSCADPDDPVIVTPPIGPLSYSLSVTDYEPLDRPAPVPAPLIYIDGVVRTSLDVEYAEASEAENAEHLIELRHGDTVYFTTTTVLRLQAGCLEGARGATVFRESSLCQPSWVRTGRREVAGRELHADRGFGRRLR